MDGDRGIGGGGGAGACGRREVRVERLLSVRDLAQLTDVAPRTVYLIEVGRMTPRLSVIRRLAAALEVDPQAVIEFRRAIRDHVGVREPASSRLGCAPRMRRLTACRSGDAAGTWRARMSA